MGFKMKPKSPLTMKLAGKEKKKNIPPQPILEDASVSKLPPEKWPSLILKKPKTLPDKIKRHYVDAKKKKSPAWTRKAGKSPSGGLNAAGRASYKKGTLKAPTKSKTSSRRKSFCARMSGMKKKLTSAKTAKNPNSRINKSLRKWDC